MHTNALGFNPRSESFFYSVGSSGVLGFWDVSVLNKIKLI